MKTNWKDELLSLRAENQALKQALERDELTGLFNARYLRSCLMGEVQRRISENLEPSLIFIDVDHFKLVNEQHGHQAASHILSQIGNLMARHIRGGDIAFRFGGDEFVVLVNGGVEGAIGAAERLRAAIEAHRFHVSGLKGHSDVQVTVSLGVKVIKAGESIEKILDEADRAMFEAKRRSRNTLALAA